MEASSTPFTHLHVHSQYSLLNSTIRIPQLIHQAVEYKMSAVAMTDYGNLFGVLEFYDEARKHGLKPIVGCHLYVSPGGRAEKNLTISPDGESAPYLPSRSGLQSLLLLVQNQQGYQNLCRLVSLAYLEGFYYKPRIDKEILQQYSEGLIAISPSLKGEVGILSLAGDMNKAKEALTWYQKLFQDRFYLELQQNGVPYQMVINQRFQTLAGETGVPLVATADCHYLKKEDVLAHEVMMAIQAGRQIEDLQGYTPPSQEFYFKSAEQMVSDFEFCPEAVQNTQLITDLCQFEFCLEDAQGKKIYHFPDYRPPDGSSLEKYLMLEAQRGLDERLKGKEDLPREGYNQRLKKELDVIIDMGFPGYYLIVADFIKEAKRLGVPVGPGRGSGAGSLVAWCLEITDLDPIEHGLLFERFLNPERVSLPDFDIDFCMEQRDRVIDYVTQKYGKECVAQIITFGKLQARGVLRDVGRVLGYAATEMDGIAKLVPSVLNITLEQAFEQEPRLVALCEESPKNQLLFDTCRQLEGLPRHASIHAAGVVISNQPMMDICPLYRGKEGESVIQFDMINAEKIGLIKFDFLGLKTLTFLKKTVELIHQYEHEAQGFQLESLELKDDKTFELLCQGDTSGVFQLESSGMQELLKKVRPDSFDDIVAINALYRPGPMGSGMLDDFIGRKHGLIDVEYPFAELEEILKETYGVIVYQEQVQQVAVTLANYTLGGADLLRRAMGKKKPAEMAKQKEMFVNGAVNENHHPQDKVEDLFDLMAKFAGYGFNKSHAAAYAMISFHTAYLKAHYTDYFFASLLTVERENTDKVTRYIHDAKNHDIEVLSPHINESETDFTVTEPGKIRFGMGAIKGVGQIAIDQLIASRNEKGEFEDIFDLCSRVSNRIVNKRVLEALIKAGAFDCFGVERSIQFEVVDSALERGAQIQKRRDDSQASFLDVLGEDDESFSQRKLTYPEAEPWTRQRELKYEKDTVGFFVSGHPLDSFETEIKKYTNTTIAKLKQASSSHNFLVAGYVSSFKEIMTKKNQRMAFLQLEDQTDSIEAVVFSDFYLENESLLKSQVPLWLKVYVETDKEENKLLFSKKNSTEAHLLEYAYETLAKEVHFHVTAGDKFQDQLGQVKEALQQECFQGDKRIYFHLNQSDRCEVVFSMKSRVDMSRYFIDQVKSVFETNLRQVEFF